EYRQAVWLTKPDSVCKSGPPGKSPQLSFDHDPNFSGSIEGDGLDVCERPSVATVKSNVTKRSFRISLDRAFYPILDTTRLLLVARFFHCGNDRRTAGARTWQEVHGHAVEVLQIT